MEHVISEPMVGKVGFIIQWLAVGVHLNNGIRFFIR